MSSLHKSLFHLEEDHISPSVFHYYTDFLYKKTGIHLTNDSKNIALFKHRLQKLLRSYQLDSFEDLASTLKKTRSNDPIVTDFINCLTTNTTEFYREHEHFEFLPKMVNEFNDQDTIYIWCSACSTGQEPYTILFNLHQKLSPYTFSKIKILATDIDTNVLKTATDGAYTEDQVSNLKPIELDTYFDSVGDLYFVKEHYKKMIYFSQLNLFSFPYPIHKKFDVIFCRNVLIYFNQNDRIKICNQFIELLNPNAYLILGLSESAAIKIDSLEYTHHAIYRKKL